jgi:hypothetical protein
VAGFRVTRRSTIGRTAASALLAGALLVGTAGCSLVAVQATQIEYDPSDGVGTRVGDVSVRNLLGLPDDDGENLSLLVTLVNHSDEGQRVSLQYETETGARSEIVKYVGANASVGFGNTEEEEQIILPDTDVPAGALLPVFVTYGSEAGEEMLVPVVEPIAEYSTLTPVEPRQTPTVTPTQSPEPTEPATDDEAEPETEG